VIALAQGVEEAGNGSAEGISTKAFSDSSDSVIEKRSSLVRKAER
jgi:hypothetical protein